MIYGSDMGLKMANGLAEGHFDKEEHIENCYDETMNCTLSSSKQSHVWICMDPILCQGGIPVTTPIGRGSH